MSDKRAESTRTDIYLHDIGPEDVKLFDQVLARKMVMETGVLPAKQVVAQRRNDTIRAWIKKTADQERTATAGLVLRFVRGGPEPATNAMSRFREKFKVLLTELSLDGAELRLVVDRSELEKIRSYLSARQQSYLQEY